jgi:uncharacterized repeat protein (TIGR03803 family)
MNKLHVSALLAEGKANVTGGVDAENNTIANANSCGKAMKANNPNTTTYILILTLSLIANVPTQAFEPQTLFNFQLRPDTNGVRPEAGLTLGPDGNFYGTTRDGGTNSFGTIFKVTPDGVLTFLFAFNGTNGAAPQGGLALGKDGNFYGTTALGGSAGFGTVFRFSANRVLTTLASFNGTNGANPQCQLVMDSNGTFYGTAPEQGPNGFGTVFRITTNGVLTTLVSFTGDNGANPEDGLAPGNDGNFYGTTANGGIKNLGTVFRITPGGALTTLFSFVNEGTFPLGGLVQGADGTLYGTTGFGSTNPATLDFGTIFKITTNGVLTTLFEFHFTDGAEPSSKLIFGPDGNLYGTTGLGGSTTNDPTGNGLGTVFQITTNGAFSSLFLFQDTNGSHPQAPLVLGNDENLYGVTAQGGTGRDGTIFRIVLTARFTSIALRPGGSVLITGSGPPDTAYRLLASNDLSLPVESWTVLTNSAFAADGKFSFTDTAAAAMPARFYRVSFSIP